MKAIYFHTAGAIALTFGIAACVPSAEPPAPTPPPVAAPTPTPTPPLPPVVQEPRYDNYLDAPQTEGTWRYENEPDEKLAMFMSVPDGPAFIMRCAQGQVALARFTRAAAQRPLAMSIKTETTTRQLSAAPVEGRPLVAATLNPRDPLLDAMAITKGRFAVEVEGERTLYLPAWVEVSRVIEDCR